MIFQCQHCGESYDGQSESKYEQSIRDGSTTNATHDSFNLEMKRQRLTTKRKT